MNKRPVSQNASEENFATIMEEKMKKLEEAYAKRIEELERKISESETSSPPEKKEEGVRLDDYVEIISLSPVPLNLSTQGNGRGKLFKFSKFGDKKSILYRDLVDIIENHRTFTDAGYFYITNPKIVRKNGLDPIYENILTKEKILEVLQGEKDTAISLYESANQQQQALIVDMILQKLQEDPDSIDLNIVDKIGRISGVNLMDKINYSKEILEAEEE